MTSRQKKFVCWLSTGRQVTAFGNMSVKNPKLLMGQIDTDPRRLKQPELDEFLSWWRDLEERHATEGIQIQLKLGCGFGEPLLTVLPKTKR